MKALVPRQPPALNAAIFLPHPLMNFGAKGLLVALAHRHARAPLRLDAHEVPCRHTPQLRFDADNGPCNHMPPHSLPAQSTYQKNGMMVALHDSLRHIVRHLSSRPQRGSGCTWHLKPATPKTFSPLPLAEGLELAPAAVDALAVVLGRGDVLLITRACKTPSASRNSLVAGSHRTPSAR